MIAASRVVAVVDDHSLFAESLVLALRGRSVDARSIRPETFTSSRHLVEAIVGTRAELVLLDLDLGSAGDGMGLVSELCAGDVGVVVVTGSKDADMHGEALRNGALTVISKSAPFDEVLHTVERIHNGLPAISREARAALVGLSRERAAYEQDVRARFALLTMREAEVLGELMLGHRVSQIAGTRRVSESTVRTQVKAILAKLQVTSQITAVGLAHQIRWEPPAVVSSATRDALSGTARRRDVPA